MIIIQKFSLNFEPCFPNPLSSLKHLQPAGNWKESMNGDPLFASTAISLN